MLPPVPQGGPNTLTSSAPLASGQAAQRCKVNALKVLQLCIGNDSVARITGLQSSGNVLILWNSTNKALTGRNKNYQFALTKTGDLQVLDPSRRSTAQVLWSSGTGGLGLAPHTLQLELDTEDDIEEYPKWRDMKLMTLRDYNTAVLREYWVRALKA